jgi:hypothetical protein
MEQVFDGLSTALRAMLGLLIVVGPGVLFWLVVTGVIVAVRWVTQRGPFHRVHHEGRAISGSSPVKN